jgi:pyruvate/2-oxoglutarate dehydrogenase complex dihydrolipoamide dehydrogenase (E3) component
VERMRADVVVIGMGPGGEEVAERLAAAGLDVVAVERELVGGECPYWGCVPSKMMIRAADLLAEGRRIPGLAGRSTVVPDWAPVARRIREEATDDWNDQVAADRFTGQGGRLVRGSGRLAGPGRVAVETTHGAALEIEAGRAVVLATGSSAVVPPIPGLDQVDYWINRQAIEAEAVPSSLTVLGGGAIGLELAQVFARFGSRVNVVEALDRILANEEPEAADLLGAAFERDGITVRTGSAVTGARHAPWSWRTGPGSRPSAFSWRPAGGPIPASWASTPLAWIPTRNGCPWTTTFGWRPACGPWVTSRARACSPTWRCTTPGS